MMFKKKLRKINANNINKWYILLVLYKHVFFYLLKTKKKTNKNKFEMRF